MGELNTRANVAHPDDIYQALIDLHDGCTDAESHLRNAKLILCLANHIGDANVIAEAVAVATASGDSRADTTATRSDKSRGTTVLAPRGFHRVAFRCRDAKETVEFYQRVLGMDFQLAIAEGRVPSTGDYDPYMHVFMDAGNGNTLAFFEIPEQPGMDRDRDTPIWTQHIAIRVGSIDELIEAKRHVESCGLEVLGPVDHGIFKSIYFSDPSGHRLELTVDTRMEEQMTKLREVAPAMLQEWSETKRPPRHAAWLHTKTADDK